MVQLAKAAHAYADADNALSVFVARETVGGAESEKGTVPPENAPSVGGGEEVSAPLVLSRDQFLMAGPPRNRVPPLSGYERASRTPQGKQTTPARQEDRP
jgi:hypothetical protein